ncbi:MAG: hypothetical protein D8M57_04255 [Candidatus Scalindua sp. AMX11]|nr:hypothetical protein [Planctomycetota bacterium]RZV92439.1 MAG: hypothetical protein EX341_05175 [Candidatus Scalindua sp. SCAELEC01]TDE66032.1 MAG: hypothetical protein D8M57_04255 [Candidatus Scalindua sp. AMX11]GJQ59003.1 MAG: hypothetical protein SCALA701_18040 [Candidatus Scalindua sp.]
MNKTFKRYILIPTLVIVALLILFSCFFVYFALDRVPFVNTVQTVTTEDALRARALAKKVNHDLMNSGDQPITFSATEDDLNSLFAFGNRSVSKLTGQVLISPELFELFTTIKIPHNPVGNYLNVCFNIAPSDYGFKIVRASLGSISVPGSLARFLIAFALDLAVGNRQGKYLLSSIDSVVLTDTSISIHMQPIPDLKQSVQEVRQRLKYVRDEIAIMGKPETVRIYYVKLMELSEQIDTKEPVSLSYFIGQLFRFAQERGGNPVYENRAAILALATYFGHRRVEQMIGNVRTEEMKLYRPKTKNVVLANRTDLRLHFVISAALKIASASGITHVIGEFKELLDAGHGGSGFSFVDLAADRAGVKFAEMATDSRTAIRVQQLLGNNPYEEQFFPSIKGLPEKLSKEVFEHYFGNIESDTYLSLVSDIDTCIEQLPAYTDGRDESSSGLNDCNIASVVPIDLM